MFHSKSDDELLQMLASGSDEGFGEICRRYTRRLYAYCQRYTRCGPDLEELVQDIFLDLWNYRTRIDRTKSLDPLLMTIARRRCVDMVRSSLNAPAYEYFADSSATTATDCSVDHRIEYEEYVTLIRKLVHHLPPLQRQVVELSRFEHLTNSEIATRIGISEKTVRNRLSLGLKTLRRQIDGTIYLTAAISALTII